MNKRLRTSNIPPSVSSSSTILEKMSNDVINEMIRVVSPKIHLSLEWDILDDGIISYCIKLKMHEYFSQEFYFTVEKTNDNTILFMYDEIDDDVNGVMYSGLYEVDHDVLEFTPGIPTILEFIDDQIVIHCNNWCSNTFYITNFDKQSIDTFKKTWANIVADLIKQ